MNENLQNISTEAPNVKMTMCHFTKGELEGMDALQGGPSIDPETGLREYSKLAEIIEIPEVKEIFKHVSNEILETGDISPELNKIYQHAQQKDLPFREAPKDKLPPTKQIRKLGRGEDKYLALAPWNLVQFFIEMNGGHYSTNPKTGLLEFGGILYTVGRMLGKSNEGAKKFAKGASDVGKSIIRVGSTIAGAFFGGPLGAGIGSFLGNVGTGANFLKSLNRGLGAYGLGSGIQALGQAAGLNAATPYTAGFFGRSNPISSIFGVGSDTASSGLNSAASAAKNVADTSLGVVGSVPSTLSNIGNMVGNVASHPLTPLALLGGQTYLAHQAAKQHYKDLNEQNAAHNRDVEKTKHEMGYYLPWDESSHPRKRWKKNPLYTNRGIENPLIEESYKKGGLIKSLVKSTGIKGPGTGQSDSIKTTIPAGSYIIDASTVSDLGDGSSTAGIKALNKLEKQIKSAHSPHIIEHVKKLIVKHGEQTPVYVANEEYKFDPVTVALKGGGSIKKGAEIFKGMVHEVRKHKSSNGLGLPPKAKTPMQYIEKYLNKGVA